MGKIFYIMGKSSSGKDSIYRQLEADQELGLRRLVIYTTRPIRDGEENGREYFFVDENKLKEFRRNGKLIEARTYQTVYGPWTYFTADDGQVSVGNDSYLGIGTLESFVKLREYYGDDVMRPVYIEVEDGERLLRAIARERQQKTPQYEEMCRRFLADAADFSEEKLTEAGITRRFINKDMEGTIREITEYIRRDMSGMEKQDKRISIWR